MVAQTLTDAAGNFRFDSLPAGDFNLKISAVERLLSETNQRLARVEALLERH